MADKYGSTDTHRAHRLELIPRLEELRGRVEELWTRLRVTTQRNDELWRLLEGLSDAVESGAEAEGTRVARQKERDTIVAEQGKVYKELVALYRSTAADLPPTANDCFDDLDF